MNKNELLRELMAAEKSEPTSKISAPADIVPLLLKYGNKEVENFYAICLGSDHSVIKVKHISKGLINRCIVHPREVFRYAIRVNSQSIIIAHNHPSGSLKPSHEDNMLTQRMVDAGNILGIEVLDHIIICKYGYKSYLEDSEMPSVSHVI